MIERTERIVGVNGVTRTISLNQVDHKVERDLLTDEWIIRIPDSEIRRVIITPFSRIHNVFIEWICDKVGGEP